MAQLFDLGIGDLTALSIGQQQHGPLLVHSHHTEHSALVPASGGLYDPARIIIHKLHPL